MNKQRAIMSFICLIFSLFAFLFATYAWFAVSTSVENSNMNISVDPGIVFSYDISFFSHDSVYEYDNENGCFVLYNATYPSGITLTYSNYSYFSGVLMKQYDPLIPVNNINNNVILELVLHYSVEDNTSASLKAKIDTNLVTTNIISDFGLTPGVDNIYYFSQVSQIQQMMTSTYASSPVHSNLYSDLTADFSAVETYPYSNFYNISDIYDNTIEINFASLNMTFDDPTPDIYLYFNFSYWETKVQDILIIEGISSSINDLAVVEFFSDVLIEVREEVGV